MGDSAVLCRFPIESRGRRKKLREVGCVTAICAACFTLRAVIVAWSAIDSEDADLVRLPTVQVSLPHAHAVGCLSCFVMVSATLTDFVKHMLQTSPYQQEPVTELWLCTRQSCFTNETRP